MGAFNRAEVITGISRILRRISMRHCTQLMTDCGLPEVRRVGAFHESYLPRRLQGASDHQLAMLSSILKQQYDFGKPLAGRHAVGGVAAGFHLLLTARDVAHSSDDLSALSSALALSGITCHWLSGKSEIPPRPDEELLLHLKEMAALIVLAEDEAQEKDAGGAAAAGFYHQQVGFALGAGKPLYLIRRAGAAEGASSSGQAGCGLLDVGKAAVFDWPQALDAKELALEVIDTLLAQPLLGAAVTDLLVRQLIGGARAEGLRMGMSHQVIGFCRRALASSMDLTAGQLYEMRRAARENPEIREFAAGRGPDLIEDLCRDAEQRFELASAG